VTISFLKRNINVFLFCTLITFLPVVLGTGFYINVMILAAIYSVTAIGLCLLVGYTGQLSIAHAAFFGLGAYASGILTSKFGLAPCLALFAAVISVGVIAYLIGLVVLRFRGHYLAIVTLSVVVIVEVLIKELAFVTGGDQGLSGIPPFSLGHFVFDSELKVYYLVWIILIALFVFSLNIANSKVGRALRAIKEGEEIARIIGVHATRYKAYIFVLSSVYAVVSGVLYSHYVMFLSPQVASLTFAFEIILMVAFGGIGSIWGVVFGVASILFLSEYLRGFDEYRLIIYGILLVVITLFFPRGLLYGIHALFRNVYETVSRRGTSSPLSKNSKGIMR
jgi:branched-chain amino acid transport system permease protein